MKNLHYNKRLNNFKFKKPKLKKKFSFKNKKKFRPKNSSKIFFTIKRKIIIIILLLILQFVIIHKSNKLYNIKEIFQFIINSKKEKNNFFF